MRWCRFPSITQTCTSIMLCLFPFRKKQIVREICSTTLYIKYLKVCTFLHYFNKNNSILFSAQVFLYDFNSMLRPVNSVLKMFPRQPVTSRWPAVPALQYTSSQSSQPTQAVIFDMGGVILPSPMFVFRGEKSN